MLEKLTSALIAMFAVFIVVILASVFLWGGYQVFTGELDIWSPVR